MARQEGKLSISIIFNADFRLTLDNRPKLLIINLIVILTATAITGISPDNQLRLNLSRPYNNSLTDNKGPNLIRSEITDTLDLQFGTRAIDNADVVVSLGLPWNFLVFGVRTVFFYVVLALVF